MNDFRLCYVDGPFAYFTTQKLSDQWGDDWNDAPYEHNAGRPYEWSETDKAPKWEILKVAFEAPLTTPDSDVSNCSYCVRDINKGQVAWLESEPWKERSFGFSRARPWTSLLARLKAPEEKSTWKYDHHRIEQERRRRRTRQETLEGHHQEGPQRAHEKDSKTATEEVIHTCPLTTSDRLLIF